MSDGQRSAIIIIIMIKYLVSKHALLLTDGSDHLIHFLRHFLEKPVSVLDTRGADGLTLPQNSGKCGLFRNMLQQTLHLLVLCSVL